MIPKLTRRGPRHPLRRPWSARRSLRRLLGLLALVITLHVAAIVFFEEITPFEALWLTLTTMTTVGYGDYTAQTLPGRLATMLLVFLGGIWIAFHAAATYFDNRADRRERMRYGRWRWNMKDHILIMNVPSGNSDAYLTRLVQEFQSSRRFKPHPVQLLCTCFRNGLPDPLARLGVVHHIGEAWDNEALEDVSAVDAEVIVVLAQSDTDPSTDGRTLDIVDRLRQMGVKSRILVECVDDANRPRFRRFGADITVRPLRGYPEMIVRALAAPGSESILEDLFTTRGDECWRYDIDITGHSWGDLVAKLVQSDIGVPIAYRSVEDGRMRINPPPATPVHADKLYVLVREGNARPDEEIAALLAQGRAALQGRL